MNITDSEPSRSSSTAQILMQTGRRAQETGHALVNHSLQDSYITDRCVGITLIFLGRLTEALSIPVQSSSNLKNCVKNYFLPEASHPAFKVIETSCAERTQNLHTLNLSEEQVTALLKLFQEMEPLLQAENLNFQEIYTGATSAYRESTEKNKEVLKILEEVLLPLLQNKIANIPQQKDFFELVHAFLQKIDSLKQQTQVIQQCLQEKEKELTARQQTIKTLSEAAQALDAVTENSITSLQGRVASLPNSTKEDDPIPTLITTFV